MSFEYILSVIKLLLGGQKSLPELVSEDRWIILVPFVATLLAAAPVLLAKEKIKAAIVSIAAAAAVAVPLLMAPASKPVVGAPGPGPKTSSPPQPTPSPLPPRPRYSVHQDTTLTKVPRFHAQKANTTAAVCEADCTAEKSCVAYVYDPPSRDCKLSTTLGERTRLSASIVGIKEP